MSIVTAGRILLTGANGFIGVQIARALLQRGHKVVGAVREESKATRLRQLFPNEIANSSLSFGIVPDITQPGAFDSVLTDGKPFDAVIHAGSPLSFSVKDVEQDLYRPAVEGTIGILKSTKENAPSVKRVVITSSFAAVVDRSKGWRPDYVYSDKDWNPTSREDGLREQRIGYGVSKTLAEKAAWDFVEAEKPEFTLTTLCPPFVLGPAEQVTNVDRLNESTGMIYAAFVGKAAVPMSGYVWVDVRDIALAHVLAIESPAAANQRYLVAAGKYAPQQVIDYMWKTYPARAAEKGISKGSPGKLWPEGGVFTVDMEKSAKDLGIKYRSLEETLRDTFTRLEELEALDHNWQFDHWRNFILDILAMASKQRVLSSYFSQPAKSSSTQKRPAPDKVVTTGESIDLTLSDSDSDAREPPSKRTRISPSSDAKNAASSSPPPADSLMSSSMGQKWGFTSISGASTSKNVASSASRPTAEIEALRKKLVGEVKGKSPATGKDTKRQREPIILEESDGEDDGENLGDKGEKEDEEAPNQLMRFANPSSKKRAAKAKGKIPADKTAVGSGGKGRGPKKVEELGPAGLKYTPLEKQILALKEKHRDAILMFEVGYKFRFFGEDARVASRELGIICFTDKNFLCASIPVTRRDVHLKKLISQGYKVGIIEQTETAALKKAGDNRSAPFDRQLTQMYTAATFVDELGSADDIDAFAHIAAPPIACIIEELRGGMGSDELVNFAFVAVTPATGDIIYDIFDDTYMRSEIETRMAHVRPLELLLPEQKLTRPTEKILAHIGNQGNRIRVERYDNSMSYTEAFELVSAFYRKHGDTSPQNASEGFRSGKLMGAVVDFPKNVIIALAYLMRHLESFQLSEVFLRTEFFTSFVNRSHMLVSGNSLHNLEIFRNQTDFTESGSLVWVLNKTKTKFGSRMLRSWIGRPLVNKDILQQRVDAVEEILNTKELKIERMQLLLKGLPDLVKGLCRIQYRKATPLELATMLTAWNRVATALDPIATPKEAGFESDILNDIAYALPTIRGPLAAIMGEIDLAQARDNEKAELWVDTEKYPKIDEAKFGILAVESELQDHLKEIRRTLDKPNLKYISVSGIDFLIEVRNGDTKKVPVSWQRISSTKAVTRFHTPQIKAKIHERDVYKETLVVEANKAFSMFLGEVAEHYSVLRNVTMKLATLDCLSALAVIAQQPGYVKPEFFDDDRLEVDGGRHPMVEALRVDPFVPISCTLGGDEPRTKIITGPNMGGKSSCVRTIALVAILAQIGSYVPCRSAKVGLLDGIATRMGASDEITRGRSTFMVEVSETAEIIKTATPRTLVILDELGRGTSTFDGMAIAHAVMQHLIENVKCKTLFITHYPIIALDLEQRYKDVSCHHMGYIEQSLPSGESTINFTYKLSPGMSKSSFGIECGRLAHMPEEVLKEARRHAERMREVMEERRVAGRPRKMAGLIKGCLSTKGADGDEDESAKRAVADLVVFCKLLDRLEV